TVSLQCQDAAHELQVRLIVFDVQHRARIGIELRQRGGIHELILARDCADRRTDTRQLRPEGGADTGERVHFYAPTHRLDQRLADDQTEAYAIHAQLVRTQPLERFEEMRLLGGIDAHARVAYTNTYNAVAWLRNEIDVAAVAIVLDRVGPQVDEHLPQSLSVRAHEKVPRDVHLERDGARRCRVAEERAHLLHHVPDTHGLDRKRERAALDTR